jgi:beta-galactosidase
MIAYGGDYNPEQWPEEVWLEDVALMREAGVDLVSVGIHSWGLLEPREGRFDFGWLDRVLDLLHAQGIGVDLATPTVAPPAWFRKAYPAARPVDREGRVLGGGTRQSYCPSSPAYAEACTRITTELARRYHDHPALVMWHVSNEYGWGSAHCYCQVSETAFQAWLEAKYQDLDALNAGWGTAFWGQS